VEVYGGGLFIACCMGAEEEEETELFIFNECNIGGGVSSATEGGRVVCIH
jgi:hypothetical protein